MGRRSPCDSPRNRFDVVSGLRLSGAARRVDLGIGEVVSAAVRAHHRRRLERLGKPALAAPAGDWAEDAAPPRPGNRVEVLIDGKLALRRMVDAIESSPVIGVRQWLVFVA